MISLNYRVVILNKVMLSYMLPPFSIHVKLRMLFGLGPEFSYSTFSNRRNIRIRVDCRLPEILDLLPFSSVVPMCACARLCLTLCNPVDCSPPGWPSFQGLLFLEKTLREGRVQHKDINSEI